MSIQISVVMLGVRDVARAAAFYVDGLGAKVVQQYPGFVRCRLSEGSADLAMYEWDAVADDIGVALEGSGFRGVALHYLPDSRSEVDEVMRRAQAAGATVVRPAGTTEWGGYDGTFEDLDGHLWKVATDA